MKRCNFYSRPATGYSQNKHLFSNGHFAHFTVILLLYLFQNLKRAAEEERSICWKLNTKNFRLCLKRVFRQTSQISVLCPFTRCDFHAVLENIKLKSFGICFCACGLLKLGYLCVSRVSKVETLYLSKFTVSETWMRIGAWRLPSKQLLEFLVLLSCWREYSFCFR